MVLINKVLDEMMCKKKKKKMPVVDCPKFSTLSISLTFSSFFALTFHFFCMEMLHGGKTVSSFALNLFGSCTVIA